MSAEGQLTAGQAHAFVKTGRVSLSWLWEWVLLPFAGVVTVLLPFAATTVVLLFAETTATRERMTMLKSFMVKICFEDLFDKRRW